MILTGKVTIMEFKNIIVKAFVFILEKVLNYGSIVIARDHIDLSGIGDRFDGTYFVQSVKHGINPQGFRTTFIVVRSIGEY